MEKLFCAELILGKEKLKKLRESFVVVIGIGAVGSYATEALVRGGVGHVRLVDFDKIKLSNFNRHLLAIDANLGKYKAEAAKERIHAIHPDCQVEVMTTFAADESMDEVLAGSPDLIIDAVDSLNPKFQILATCHERKIPIISCMGAALRNDIFSVKAGDLFRVTGCPLARELRRRLRHNKGIQKGIFCIYSDTPVSEEPAQATAMLNSDDDYQRGRPRKKLGSLSTVTGVFGLVVAHYSIRFLTGDLKL